MNDFPVATFVSKKAHCLYYHFKLKDEIFEHFYHQLGGSGFTIFFRLHFELKKIFTLLFFFCSNCDSSEQWSAIIHECACSCSGV